MLRRQSGRVHRRPTISVRPPCARGREGKKVERSHRIVVAATLLRPPQNADMRGGSSPRAAREDGAKMAMPGSPDSRPTTCGLYAGQGNCLATWAADGRWVERAACRLIRADHALIKTAGAQRREARPRTFFRRLPLMRLRHRPDGSARARHPQSMGGSTPEVAIWLKACSLLTVRHRALEVCCAGTAHARRGKRGRANRGRRRDGIGSLTRFLAINP